MFPRLGNNCLKRIDLRKRFLFYSLIAKWSKSSLYYLANASVQMATLAHALNSSFPFASLWYGGRVRACVTVSVGEKERAGVLLRRGGGEGDKIWKGGGQGVPLLLLIFVVLAAAVGALDVEASTFKVTSQHLKRGQKDCSNISLFLSSSTCFYSRKEFFFFLFWRKWHVVLEQNMIWILIEEISAIITFIT